MRKYLHALAVVAASLPASSTSAAPATSTMPRLLRHIHEYVCGFAKKCQKVGNCSSDVNAFAAKMKLKYELQIKFFDELSSAVVIDHLEHRTFMLNIADDTLGVMLTDKDAAFTPLESLPTADRTQSIRIFQLDIALLVTCARDASLLKAI